MNWDWNTFYNFLQGIGAIASAFIAYYVYMQGKKIKDLADIVKKIDAQNIIIQKRFEIEKYAVIGNLIPYYTDFDKLQEFPWEAIVEIRNIGIKASRIYVNEDPNADYVVHLYDHHADRGEMVKIKINTKDKSPLENINFQIISTGINGLTSKQSIFKNPHHDINIGPPEF